MGKQPTAAFIERVNKGDYVLHQQKFDPSLPDYKQDICPKIPNCEQSQLGPAFYSIYDYQGQKYTFVEDSVSQVIGYTPQEIYNENINFIKRGLWSEDKEVFEKMVLRAINHLHYEVPKEEHEQYTINYDYEFRHANGKKLHLLQQTVKMVRDRKGSIVYSVEKTTDISHRPPGTTPMLSIYGPDPDCSVTYFPKRMASDVKGRKFFSPSELRVLELLDKAYSTHEIARILNLSKNTIATHRKNMLKKAGVGDTLKLLNFSRKRNIL